MTQQQRQVPPNDKGNTKKKTENVGNVDIDDVLGEIDSAMKEAAEEQKAKKTQQRRYCCGDGPCC